MSTDPSDKNPLLEAADTYQAKTHEKPKSFVIGQEDPEEDHFCEDPHCLNCRFLKFSLGVDIMSANLEDEDSETLMKDAGIKRLSEPANVAKELIKLRLKTDVLETILAIVTGNLDLAEKIIDNNSNLVDMVDELDRLREESK